MKLSLHDIIEKREHQLEADIGPETLMMRVESGHYFSVEETGQAIWRSIEGSTSVSGIIDLLLAEYDVDRGICEVQTMSFLNDLLDHGLIIRVGTNETLSGSGE
ncbi:PqqD family peptide modification chaperone [Marivita geojedonensis]|uniref:PqqD family protein n=1 Tax=Marivita geojedonensis TaxID=1123756 RepID=A0A1X4NRE7_9RHOB|nr:PqqD family peptide modification chaperone [Marivita geojedonensis]OSQ53519.1 hypothetical protein MGEO_03095 [Marivita geojedonensis]PRY81466.1 coenzyme PQQ synthesis protein D (PqqD) [Marivita geojedonensis]